mmetsp:Transcript_10216/g.32488  ORF Transcript_10216/g.32488 Transcript_10216/m.32488 type:complete len:253 (-) Transcript_10216:1129-1887(-)
MRRPAAMPLFRSPNWWRLSGYPPLIASRQCGRWRYRTAKWLQSSMPSSAPAAITKPTTAVTSGRGSVRSPSRASPKPWQPSGAFLLHCWRQRLPAAQRRSIPDRLARLASCAGLLATTSRGFELRATARGSCGKSCSEQNGWMGQRPGTRSESTRTPSPVTRLAQRRSSLARTSAPSSRSRRSSPSRGLASTWNPAQERIFQTMFVPRWLMPFSSSSVRRSGSSAKALGTCLWSSFPKRTRKSTGFHSPSRT